MGAANLLGYLFAAIIGTQISVFGVSGLFIIMAIILFGSAALTCYQPEPKVNYSINFQLKRINLYQFITNDMIEPLVKSVDFRYLFASRFFYQIGIATVQQFLQYWIADCASSVLSNIAGVSLAMIPLLVASPIAALLIPANKRKIVVYVSTLFMILACVLMIFVSKYWITFLISFIFGIGFGPFLSVEFAMLLDILPNPETAARDISIWHMALVLPQLTATPIAGIIRDYFQEVGKQLAQQCLGYQILFSITIFYLIVGAWFTRIIKNVK